MALRNYDKERAEFDDKSLKKYINGKKKKPRRFSIRSRVRTMSLQQVRREIQRRRRLEEEGFEDE